MRRSRVTALAIRLAINTFPNQPSRNQPALNSLKNSEEMLSLGNHANKNRLMKINTRILMSFTNP
jgi:hypothetical protein